MHSPSRSRVFPTVRVLGLLVIVSSVLTIAVFISRLEVAAVKDSPVAVALSLSEFATGLKEITSMTSAGTGDDRLFVNEKAGRIIIVEADGRVVDDPFLDISDRVTSISEAGFLGLAFHPDYANNGYFYVNYTNYTSPTLQTRISRFEASADPNIADKSSEDILLTVTQPEDAHNAGDIHFGPDGYLYIPLGDGGHGGDKEDNAQNPEVLLGKVVRIDVKIDGESGNGKLSPDCSGDGTGNYWVPLTNPLKDGPGGACDEIWASGLRNPWRSSFDRATGDFFIGDVGEGTREEINFQKAGSAGGENYGWSCYEGKETFNPVVCETLEESTFPIFDYENPTDGCSVTGGYVYRGSKFPAMEGRYFLADFCSGNFWDLVQNEGIWQYSKHTNIEDRSYVAFGEDSSGELFVASFNPGEIYRLEGQPVLFDEFLYLPVAISQQEVGSFGGNN